MVSAPACRSSLFAALRTLDPLIGGDNLTLGKLELDAHTNDPGVVPQGDSETWCLLLSPAVVVLTIMVVVGVSLELVYGFVGCRNALRSTCPAIQIDMLFHEYLYSL